ncbi:NADPH-dependent aldehyde reductase-like protein chloroplastic [Bienertia sinuspersici]
MPVKMGSIVGTFLCIKEATNILVCGGGGKIVTLSSSTTASFKEKYGAYTASKAAVEAIKNSWVRGLRVVGLLSMLLLQDPCDKDVL